MTRYTKLDPKNPAAGMRFTKTRKGQEKDRVRDELFQAMEKLGIRLSKPTLETLDKRLGVRGLSEMLTEFQALIERLDLVVQERDNLRTRVKDTIRSLEITDDLESSLGHLSEEATAKIAEMFKEHFQTVIEIPPELRKK